MKRWMGWMLVGAMTVGGAAFAQESGQLQPSEERSGQDPGTDDTTGMFPMGEAEPIDEGKGLKDATGGVRGTGGSGQGGAGMQAQGAQPDARGAQLMDQGLLPIPTEEKAYLETLHHAHQLEVQLGQLAQQKGTAKGVKDFGARLVKDHQAADQKLMTYAQKKNLQLGEPEANSDFKKTLKNAEQAAMARLQSLQGPAFDRAFLAHMVGHHDMDIAKVLAGQQQFASNTELKGQLDSLLPTLRQHRDQAYRLLGQEKPRQARSAPQGR